MSSKTEIPDEIEALMTDEELKNMRNLDGWAVGEIVELRDGQHKTQVIEHGEAWVELLNGQGRSDKFAGVRFMMIDENGAYMEAYAHPGLEEANGNEPCFFVWSWVEPSDPEIGLRYPKVSGEREWI